MKKITVVCVCVVLAAVAALFLFFNRRHKPQAVVSPVVHKPALVPKPSPVQPTKPLSPPKPIVTTAKPPSTESRPASGSPDKIKLVAGLAGDKDYQSRINAVHGLGKNLTRQEIRSLYDFLASKPGQEPLININAIKNDALSCLLNQETLPVDLGSRILGMYRDKSNDLMWRGYCVQFFGLYYQRKWKPGSAVGNNTERADLAKAYNEALAEKDSEIAGTALLGITRLSSQYPEFDKKALSDTAFALLSDDKTSLPSRIAAMQICGTLQTAQALPAARMLAQTGEAIPLRLASIATLGSIGENQDISLLQGILAGSDTILGNAASEALKHLTNRLQQASTTQQ